MENKELSITFRQANENDLDSVNQIFIAAIEEMNRNNIFQWDELYPTKQDMRDDISQKQMFVGMLEDKLASVYVINTEHNEEYKFGAWQYPNATYRVIHRLCVDPKLQNKGIGLQTLKHIESELKESGIETIRLDVFMQNPYALKMYDKQGYKNTGYIDLRKGKFCLMEKKL